jgi:hypothetical protein
LYLGSDNLGYYDSGWKTYMDKNGNFFLNGTNGSLDWNSGTDTLSIKGTVDATDGSIAGFNFNESQLTATGILINSGDSNSNALIELGGSITIENRSGLTDPAGLVSAPTINGEIGTADANVATYTSTGTTALSYTDTTGVTCDTSSTFTSNEIYFSTPNNSDYNGKTVTISGTVDAPSIGSSTKYLQSTLSNAGTIYIHQAMGKIGVVLQKSSTGTSSWSDVSTWQYALTQTGQSSTIDFGSTSRSFSVGTTLEANKYYRIITKIFDISVFSYNTSPGAGTELSIKYGAPRIINTPTLTMIGDSSNAFSELTKGGFQVVSSSTKAVTIPADASGDALEVIGNISATGNITAFSTSDERLKENIKIIKNPLEKVNKIKGVTFDWKDGNEDVHLFTGEDVGVIAQDVEKVIPHITNINKHHGYYGVRYEKLTPLLIEAIKELSKKVEELENKLKG